MLYMQPQWWHDARTQAAWQELRPEQRQSTVAQNHPMNCEEMLTRRSGSKKTLHRWRTTARLDLSLRQGAELVYVGSEENLSPAFGWFVRFETEGRS